MWPGLRFDGGSSVLARLWEASWQLATPGSDRPPQVANAPSWMTPLWWLAAALTPLTVITVIVADAEDWSEAAILSTALATDLVWIAALFSACVFSDPWRSDFGCMKPEPSLDRRDRSNRPAQADRERASRRVHRRRRRGR